MVEKGLGVIYIYLYQDTIIFELILIVPTKRKHRRTLISPNLLGFFIYTLDHIDYLFNV